MTTTATRSSHALDHITVTTDMTPDVELIVAIYGDGDQAVITDGEDRTARGANMDEPGGNPELVAVSIGYIDDEGTWTESGRQVRSYWTDGDLSYFSALEGA